MIRPAYERPRGLRRVHLFYGSVRIVMFMGQRLAADDFSHWDVIAFFVLLPLALLTDLLIAPWDIRGIDVRSEP